MNAIEFLVALKNMKMVSRICQGIDFAKLAAELQKTNPTIIKHGMNQEDVALLVELAQTYAKVNELVKRVAMRSDRNRKLAANARNN